RTGESRGSASAPRAKRTRPASPATRISPVGYCDPASPRGVAGFCIAAPSRSAASVRVPADRGTRPRPRPGPGPYAVPCHRLRNGTALAPLKAREVSMATRIEWDDTDPGATKVVGEDVLRSFYIGGVVPCPVGCGGSSELVRNATLPDGGGEIWF